MGMALSSLAYSIEDTWKAAAYGKKLLSEEEKLKKEVVRLRMENMKLRQEMRRLSLERSYGLPSVFFARTVYLNPLRINFRFSVAAGWGQGVKEGMGVVDERGNAVGKVVSPVSYNRCWVKPITSPFSAIGVEVRGNFGILKGRGEQLLVLDYIYPTSGIREGDEVITSGLDGIFPEGIPVGKVERVLSTPGIFLTVEVRPYFSLKTLRFVGIIRRW